MILRPPISTRPDTFFPYPLLFRLPGRHRPGAAAVRRAPRQPAGGQRDAVDGLGLAGAAAGRLPRRASAGRDQPAVDRIGGRLQPRDADRRGAADRPGPVAGRGVRAPVRRMAGADGRSAELLSELQTLLSNSYVVFCLKNKIAMVRQATL